MGKWEKLQKRSLERKSAKKVREKDKYRGKLRDGREKKDRYVYLYKEGQINRGVKRGRYKYRKKDMKKDK